ncbi:MAG: hypothetical protein SVU88_03155 [Candidatus Nanohaloarchaea archaeon]|nr:hypothetical protein [Candidatus Nanohaloarchaea archaeon]
MAGQYIESQQGGVDIPGDQCPTEYIYDLAIERGADPDKLPDPHRDRAGMTQRERYELWKHVYRNDPLMKPSYRTRARFRMADARERAVEAFSSLF